MYITSLQLCTLLVSYYYYERLTLAYSFFHLLYANCLGFDCSYVYHQCYSCGGLQKIHIGLSYSPWTGMFCNGHLFYVVSYIKNVWTILSEKESTDKLIFNLDAVVCKSEYSFFIQTKFSVASPSHVIFLMVFILLITVFYQSPQVCIFSCSEKFEEFMSGPYQV